MQKIEKSKFKQMIECLTKNIHHRQNAQRLRNDQKAIDKRFYLQHNE